MTLPNKLITNWKRLDPIQWFALFILATLAIAVTVNLIFSLSQNRPSTEATSDVDIAIPPGASACDAAMEDAAAIPLSQVNDEEFLLTLTECSSVDEWKSALRAHPDALGLRDLTDKDIAVALQTACWNADEVGVISTVCSAAREQSLIK